MSNVTGIGGVFFKARKDAKVLTSWYQKNLGVNFEVSGAVELKWKEDTADDNGIIPTVIKNDRWAFIRHAASRHIRGDAPLVAIKAARLPKVIMSQS